MESSGYADVLINTKKDIKNIYSSLKKKSIVIAGKVDNKELTKFFLNINF